MRVRVVAFATLGDLIGRNKVVELEEGATLGDLIEKLIREIGPHLREAIFSDDGSLHPFLKILVNGRDVEFLEGLGTRLSDGDEVAIVPPAGGG